MIKVLFTGSSCLAMNIESAIKLPKEQDYSDSRRESPRVYAVLMHELIPFSVSLSLNDTQQRLPRDHRVTSFAPSRLGFVTPAS